MDESEPIAAEHEAAPMPKMSTMAAATMPSAISPLWDCFAGAAATWAAGATGAAKPAAGAV